MKVTEWVVFGATFIASILYMIELRKHAPQGTVDTSPLSLRQRSYVLAMVILAPIVAGAVFYYGWIKRMPVKAKQANRWSLLIAAILIVVYLALGGR
jgi:hypothetical protein